MRIAGEVLGEALEALKDDIDIAVLDASNITKERRRWLADAVASSGLHCQVNTPPPPLDTSREMQH